MKEKKIFIENRALLDFASLTSSCEIVFALQEVKHAEYLLQLILHENLMRKTHADEEEKQHLLI